MPQKSITWKVLCALFFFLKIYALHSQNSAAHAQDSSKVKVFAIPIAFYTPDTRWGFGGAGIATFKSRNTLYQNSINFSFAYTLRKQILAWFPFQYYAPDMRWQTYGEVGYYRYLYEYYGIGNETPETHFETFTAAFPRLRANILGKVKTRQFAGIRLAFDDYRIVEVDSTENSLLYQSNTTGAEGGRIAGLGLLWLTDTRDVRFYPRKGWLVEYSAYTEGRYTGSAFAYQQLSLQAAHYKGLSDKGTLALNGAVMATFGDAPFYQLAMLGGTKWLRGYRIGKYRDRHLGILQAEYRQEIHERWGAVLFAGAGTVWGASNSPFKLLPNYGAGIRFKLDPKQHLNVRLDYGFGLRGNSGFYLTIGEAF